jgi:hypothetical protein
MSSYFAIKFYVNNICTQEVDFKQFLWKNFPLHNGDSEYVFYRGNAEVQIFFRPANHILSTNHSYLRTLCNRGTQLSYFSHTTVTEHMIAWREYSFLFRQ